MYNENSEDVLLEMSYDDFNISRSNLFLGLRKNAVARLN